MRQYLRDLHKTKKGFTLVEMMVSIFIFALMMVAIAGVFASQIKTYKNARTMQGDLENAQFALNYVAKTLRTASLIGYGSSSSMQDLLDGKQFGNSEYDNDFYLKPIEANEGLILYDFSQEYCVRFTFRNRSHKGYAYPALWIETQAGVLIDETEKCLEAGTWGNTTLGIYKDRRLTTGSVYGKMYAAPTRYRDHQGSRGTDTMGRATVSMKVEPVNIADTDGVKSVYIQSSVSLRDYPSDLSF